MLKAKFNFEKSLVVYERNFQTGLAQEEGDQKISYLTSNTE